MAPGAPLDALFRHEPPEKGTVSSPAAAVYRDNHGAARAPSVHELHQMNKRSESDGNISNSTAARTSTIAKDPVEDDVEMSRSSSPANHTSTGIVQSLTNPSGNKWRYAASCTSLFADGMHDATTGVLIPHIEAEYGISYGIVSCIFVANAVGFIVAATYTHTLQKMLGRGPHLALSCFLMVLGYVIIVATPPFPAVCVAFFLVGSGMATGLSPCNAFVCNLQNSTKLLGIMHGLYGIGGTLGPLISTGMVDSGGVRWSHFYFIPLGISAFNVGFNLWANWGYAEDNAKLEADEKRARGEIGDLTTETNSLAEDQTAAEAQPVERGSRFKSMAGSWKQTLSGTTLLGAALLFAYQGAEVANSGWVLSFLLAYRSPPYSQTAPPVGLSGYNPLDPQANAKSGSLGYVTSGYWGGLTLSRLFLTNRLAKWFGPVKAVHLSLVAVIFFQILVWLIPNAIAESVMIAIVGIWLGPMYPLTMDVCSKYLDPKVQISSLAVIMGLGSSGGAVGPFLVGIISGATGVWVLHPICLGLYALIGLTWWGLNHGKSKFHKV